MNDSSRSHIFCNFPIFLLISNKFLTFPTSCLVMKVQPKDFERMVLHWHISPYKVKLGSTACSLRLRSITTTTVASTVQGQANLKVKMPRIILRKFPSVCRLSTWAFKTSHYAIFCNFHCHGKKLRSHPF